MADLAFLLPELRQVKISGEGGHVAKQPGSLFDLLPAKAVIAFHSDTRLARVLTYIDGHINESIPLAAAARVACMERTAFCKFFRRSTEIGYVTFLHLVRIERATRLLRFSALSVTDVATSVGYESLRVFQRRFRQYMGITAREYRKQSTYLPVL